MQIKTACRLLRTYMCKQASDIIPFTGNTEAKDKVQDKHYSFNYNDMAYIDKLLTDIRAKYPAIHLTLEGHTGRGPNVTQIARWLGEKHPNLVIEDDVKHK